MGARMVATPLPEELLALARSQRARVKQLSAQLVDLLSTRTECYRRVARDYPDELRLVCEKHLHTALDSLIEARDVELSGVLRTGRTQARIGITLPDALRGYRLAGTYMYELLVSGGVFTAEQMLQTSTTVWRIIDAFSEALTTAYREVDGLDRSALLDRILDGRLADVEEATRVLGLPTPTKLVVLVSDEPSVAEVLGTQAVWRRNVAIVAMGLDLVRQTLAGTPGVVGVSTPFTDLTEVPTALHRARIARRCIPHDASGVVVFGDLPVAALVAGSPALAGELAQELFSRLLSLPQAEKEILLSTLEAWYTEGGSAKNAGKILYVHPNTVRYRMRRIEELTGRDLDRPQSIAELYLALQAVRLGV
jgi:hypothetical protein